MWIGGIVLVIGTLIAAWPHPVRRSVQPEVAHGPSGGAGGIINRKVRRTLEGVSVFVAIKIEQYCSSISLVAVRLS